MKKENPVLYTYAVIAFEAVVPFAILWLFEWGLWMVVCQVINILCLTAYLLWSTGYFADGENGEDNDGNQDNKEMSGNEVTAVTFGAFMSPLLFAEFLLPIWLTINGDDFLKKYNYIFGSNYTVTYEGGYISMLLTFGVGMLFAALIYHTLRYSMSLLNYDGKSFIRGILYAAAVYVILGMLCLIRIGGYNPDSDKRHYQTQMQKEEHEIDRQIESDKDRLIQKAVNDYRDQWEE